MTPWRQKTRERLAALAHEQWAGWVKWMLSRLREEAEPVRPFQGDDIEYRPTAEDLLSCKWTKRWERQIETSYSELSEPEKDSDRKEADRVLEVIGRPTEVAHAIVEVARELVELLDNPDWTEDAHEIEMLSRRVESLLIDYDVAECD